MVWFRRCTIFVGVIAFTIGRGEIATGHDPAQKIVAANSAQKADYIIVAKSDRQISLMRQGSVLRRYAIALGRQPKGQKIQEGDRRTPEGQYQIDWRNPESKFHLSLHISYPGPSDLERARSLGVEPGSMIMIHGLPNGFSAEQIGHPQINWTHGCIAVTNEEIEEIWQLVDNGTSVLIRP
jgi:murein L,D-transpeptidase YafK